MAPLVRLIRAALNLSVFGSTRPLTNLVCIITGASSGIGEALAKHLDACDAKLVIAARSTDKLEKLASSMRQEPLVVPTDVRDPEQCQNLIDRAAEHFGRIDVLVANAGFGIGRRTLATSRDDFVELWETNVLGSFDCIVAAAKVMKEQAPVGGWRGQMMLVSSVVARRSFPLFGPYAATKAAQQSLAESLRVELAEEKIAVTSVHPSTTRTNFFAEADRRGDVDVLAGPGRQFQQSPKAVAKAMARAIERPRSECWPLPGSRLLFGLLEMFPRLTDAASRKALREMEAQPSKPSGTSSLK